MNQIMRIIQHTKIEEDSNTVYNSKEFYVNHEGATISDSSKVSWVPLDDSDISHIGVEFTWKNKDSSEQVGRIITKLDLLDSDGELVADLLEEALRKRREYLGYVNP